MKVRWTVVIGVLFLASQSLAAEEPALKTQKEKLSYAIGMNIGTNMKQQGVEIDLEIMMKGLKDTLAGSKPRLSEQEIKDTLAAFQKEQKIKEEKMLKTMGDKNKKEGDAYLAQNKKKEGVKTLPSGLQYKVLKEGTGRKPKATDTVSVQYKGTFVDGTEFDSSYRRGKPTEFPVRGLIPAWTEALQLMPEGSKWLIVVPPLIGYGDKGSPPVIGPNATLVFEMELLAITDKSPEKSPEKKPEKR
jgi:FKBP-type peptidyl-prolyl cis-trans isomerase FklB